MRKGFFIAVGNELLNIKPNLYAPVLSSKLFELGIKLEGELTTPDDENAIISALEFASQRAEIIIITGGLGPTFDDKTRQAVSKYLQIPLVWSNQIEKFIKEKYGDPKEKTNLKNQCYVIKDALLIENRYGTAFGQIIKKMRRTFILLPGPRLEWEGMWNNVIKHIRKGKRIYSLRLKFADIKEVELENILKKVIERFEAEYTILAGPNICEFSTVSEDIKIIKKVKKEVISLTSNWIYGTNNDTLEGVVGRILLEKKLTLSTAESCTGGLLASTITDIPGSSAYYIGGINAYSNRIKENLLGVKKTTLMRYGAVSEETVKEMALNAKKIFKTDCAIAISGIAGPSGGSKEKPVGTVWICAICKNKISVVKKFFPNRDRAYIKRASVNSSLWELYKMIK